MAVKCTECGASIQDDSKFCRYCGAKIVVDDLKRVEVKIDNTAEIKRADYEEQESKLRQEKMRRELRKEKRRPYVILAKILSILLPFGLAALINDNTTTPLLIVLGFAMFFIHFFVFLKGI